MTKRLSPAALALTDELLAKMHGVASVSSTFLEEWWGANRRVRRVELFRLLNDLADDGRIVKLPGRRWCLPANAPKAAPVTPTPAPVVARKAPPAKPAPRPVHPVGEALISLPAGARLACVEPGVPPRVTVEMGSGSDAVKIVGAPARVAVMADAYQRQVAAEVEAAPVKAPLAPVVARKAPPAKPDFSAASLPVITRLSDVPLSPRLKKLVAKADKEMVRAFVGKAPVRTALQPPAPTSAAGRILAALRKKPDDGPGLTRRLKMNPHTVRGRLSELARAGWIEQDAACRWEVTR